MKCDAVLAWGPVHDNQVGVSHNVDDDADGVAVKLSHIITDFETLHDRPLHYWRRAMPILKPTPMRRRPGTRHCALFRPGATPRPGSTAGPSRIRFQFDLATALVQKHKLRMVNR